MAKRTLILLTLTSLMFIGGSAAAQGITEYKTINNTYIYEAPYCPGSYYGLSGGKFIIFNSQFENTNTITIESNANESAGVYCLSKNIFTNSGKYEFVMCKRNYETRSFMIGIYNENAELIYTIYKIGDNEKEYNGELQECFLSDNKLIITFMPPYDLEANVITKIYTLANSINNSSILQVQQNTNSSKLYPNPARQSVTLEYNIQGQMQEMQIVDINGRVVASYLLDPSQKQVKINTSNYKKGVYIYRYGNNSGRFVVE